MAKSEKPTIDPKNYVASVGKALHLLELFSDGPPQIPLSEIVRRAGYSRTTTYRLLMTLEHLGWVVRQDDTYQLSLRIFRVGAAAMNALQLRQEASQSLSDLAATLGETVYLIVPDGMRGVCLERIEGSAQVQIMVLEVGASLPLYCGGGSLAILAERADLFDTLAQNEPLIRPDGSQVALEDLRQTLAQTRARGYSRSIEDVTRGVGAFGAPVRNAQGKTIAAISIGGFAQTLLAREVELTDGLMAAARDISERLGYLAPR